MRLSLEIRKDVSVRPTQENDVSVNPFDIMRERFAKLLQVDPEFAALWTKPIDDEDLSDELLEREQDGEFSRESYAARYENAECNSQ